MNKTFAIMQRREKVFARVVFACAHISFENISSCVFFSFISLRASSERKWKFLRNFNVAVVRGVRVIHTKMQYTKCISTAQKSHLHNFIRNLSFPLFLSLCRLFFASPQLSFSVFDSLSLSHSLVVPFFVHRCTVHANNFPQNVRGFVRNLF